MSGPDKGAQRFPVTIEQLAESVGATRFPVETWTTLVTTAWMSRRPLGGTERLAVPSGQPTSRGQLEWQMSYRADMDPDLVDVPKLRRLSYQGTKYDILSADHLGRKDGIALATLSPLMDVEVAICDRLLGDYAVAALAGTRGYVLKFPQNFSAVGFRVSLSEPGESHLRGGIATARARVQVDAIAPVASGTDPFAQAGSLADAIDGALMDQGPFVEDGLKVKVVERADRLKFFDPDELQQVRVTQDTSRGQCRPESGFYEETEIPDLTGTFYAGEAIVGYGAEWLIGDGTSPEGFESVADVTSIVFGDMSTAVIEKTHLRSPDAHREKKATLRDSGPFVMEHNYRPAHESHSNAGGGSGSFGSGGILAMWRARSEKKMAIRLMDGSPATELPFTGTVTKYQPGEIMPDGKIELAVEVTPLRDFSSAMP